jgi:hypothetical protein
VYSFVIGANRNVREDLQVIGQGDTQRASQDPTQSAVIVASAPAQTMSLPVEPYPGGNHNVSLSETDQQIFSWGDEKAEGARNQLVVRIAAHELQVLPISCKAGIVHRLVVDQSLSPNRLSLHFVLIGTIERQGGSALEGSKRAQPLGDETALLGHLCRGQVTPVVT